VKQSTLASAILSAGVLAALMVSPAQGAVTGPSASNTTQTTSTSSSQQFHDTVFNVDLYNTRVLGLATWIGVTGGGGFVNRETYNQTLSLPPSAQEVQTAYDQARQQTRHVLDSTGGRGQIVWSDSTSVTRTTQTDIVETGSQSTQTVTAELTVGPGTVLIGDRDAGGTPFVVAFGSSNLNLNTHTHTDTTRDVTNTHTTSTRYTVTGTLDSSPIVLDLVGSGGIEASGGSWQPHPHTFNAKHRALFDFFGNGFPVAMEWVGPNDGLLVKPKADGSVDGSCLFGNATGYTNGYEQLAGLDSNRDGKVSGKELQGLSVWQDKNGNAKCEAGELRTVQALGISEFNLKHTDFKSSYVINGKSQAMFDWWPTMFEIKKNKQSV